jgi:tripartite-type tricarboxylate transporter receptor subunit TctC
VIGPHLIKNPGYDPLKDFDYITVAVQAPNVLAVPASSPHKSLADVIAYKKANPGKMTFASAGNGTSDHLTAELFWQETGTTGVHIPYKGGAPAMSDLLGAQVDATFMNINTGLNNIKAGKLRALAITSAKRSPLLPDVPTMDELGLKGVTVYSWQAFAAPKGLPADIKAKLHDALVAGLNDPAVKPKLLDLGFEIVGNTPEEFTAFQAAEFARWKKVIETGKITAD